MDFGDFGFWIFGFWGFGILDFGDFGFGILGFWGFWILDCGDFGDFGDFGFWGFWILDFWDFGDFGFWIVGILDFGDFGFWILGILGFWGFWILGILGIWDFGFWDFGDVPLGNLVTVPGGQRLESPLVCLWGPLQNQLYRIELARKQIEHFFRGQNPTKSQKNPDFQPRGQNFTKSQKNPDFQPRGNFIAMNFLAQINVDYPGRRPQAPACFKYGEEHTEEKKAYDQEYNRREVERESCGDMGGEGEGGHEDKLN